jgi:hypothetical protein
LKLCATTGVASDMLSSEMRDAERRRGWQRRQDLRSRE